MRLSNFEVLTEPEIDGAIGIKADAGRERVVAYAARSHVDDHLEKRRATNLERLSFIRNNLTVIAGVMNRKFDAGETTLERRFGSMIIRIDMSLNDLMWQRGK
jgi:hypothetical protein